MLRVQRGMTHAELNEALKRHQATVPPRERDRAKPSGPALGGVASFFGTTVQALETGKGFEAAESAHRELRSPRGPKEGPLGLPDAGPGAVLAMDLRTTSEKRLEPMEAMAFLMKALKEGRSIWIVADD